MSLRPKATLFVSCDLNYENICKLELHFVLAILSMDMEM